MSRDRFSWTTLVGVAVGFVVAFVSAIHAQHNPLCTSSTEADDPSPCRFENASTECDPAWGDCANCPSGTNTYYSGAITFSSVSFGTSMVSSTPVDCSHSYSCSTEPQIDTKCDLVGGNDPNESICWAAFDPELFCPECVQIGPTPWSTTSSAVDLGCGV